MTVAYYDVHAQAYFDATVSVDMSALRARFLSCLAPGGRVLDLGCGSGRDLRAFAAARYDAIGLDASAELAALARAHSGREVMVQPFEAMSFDREFDGIWACASLLHVAPEDLPDVFSRCGRALKEGGTIYASFKLGTGARLDGQRMFTDLTPRDVEVLLKNARLTLVELWVSDDLVAGRSGRWVNFLARA